jgi:hypothetical protein
LPTGVHPKLIENTGVSNDLLYARVLRKTLYNRVYALKFLQP